MKKLVPALAIGGFVLAVANAAVIVFAVIRGPSMAKNYISNFKLELTKTILDAVPVPEIPEMPKLPTRTGPAITSPF